MVTTSGQLTIREQTKRDQIRLAAQELFLERGFSGASTDAISREAGVSKETLYRYFPSKEELLADCLGNMISNLSASHLFTAGDSRPIGSHQELRIALLELGSGFVEALMQPDYLRLVRVIISEAPRLPHLGDVFRSAIPGTVNRRVGNILKRAEESDVIRIADTEAATRMFVGPLLTYIMADGLLSGEGQIPRPTTDRIEAIVDLYLQAITTL